MGDVEEEADLAVPASASAEDTITSLSVLKTKVSVWTASLKLAASLVSVPGPDSHPFINVYKAIEVIETLNKEVQSVSNSKEVKENTELKFWVKFARIHILSSLAKWNEVCDELSKAQKNHLHCLNLIEEEVNQNSNLSLDELVQGVSLESDGGELARGRERVNYMYIYELTRFAILCSLRDDQDKALELLKKAEEFYHDHNVKESLLPLQPGSLLEMLDSLNAETSKDMFTYILFYLGQAYKIQGEKERAILYLHMVLRRQLEKGDYNNITWGSDSSRMASVLMVNAQAFETARNILVAATTVMKNCPAEEKTSDLYKQSWADLGRTWAKFGVELLEVSSNRLKDLEEQNRRTIKFENCMKFSRYERLSLELCEAQEEFDAVLLIRSLKFPTLDVSEVDEIEMKGRFVRDFDEARSVFLPTQRWVNVARDYYNLEEFAGDHIDLMTDFGNSYKHVAFFEPSIERRIKMHKRRGRIFESLLAALNPKIYSDIFHRTLRDLAEVYETVYKLKVDKLKDRGKSLRPKDIKLVEWINDAAKAHKRNLDVFDFKLDDPGKNFPSDYEKLLLGSVLSVGRILGSICHDHPLHPDAISLGEESKQYYQYFIDYLNKRPTLKKEFKVLYDGSEDMPELLDRQIGKIQHHQRLRRANAGEAEAETD